MSKSLISKAAIKRVIKTLLLEYPDARAELDFQNPFQLLIATILSAQCTDVRVNKTTPELFKHLPSPDKIYSLEHKELEAMIKSCGLYKTKAKNIRASCEILHEVYAGEVPKSIDALVNLPGVGRKTANVLVSNAYGVPAIAVDTHVNRVSNRIGLADSSDVKKVELRLMEIIPKNLWTKMHHVLIFHGRRMCKARKPDCSSCFVSADCIYYKNLARG